MDRGLALVFGGVAVAISGFLPLRVVAGSAGAIVFESSIHAGLSVILAGSLVVIAGIAAANGLMRFRRAAVVATVATAFAAVMTSVTALSLGLEDAGLGPAVETSGGTIGAGTIVFAVGVVLIAGNLASTLVGKDGNPA